MHESATLLDAPTSPDVLPDIPGGQPNLLPLAVLSRPLQIQVPMWAVSRPPQTLRVYWNDLPAHEKSWDGPVPPEDLLVPIPVTFLEHGQAQVTYKVLASNGSEADSAPLSLTIDKAAPVLGGSEGALMFDIDVVNDGVTERYLESNDDRLLAQVPEYMSPAVADILTYYWDRAPFANEKVAEYVVTQANIDQPIVLEFSGEMIRERGDGPRYIHYQVRDRAGNLSARSMPVTLIVAATPVPRSLVPVLIPQAEGSGAQRTLSLDDFYPPLLVQVPSEAIVYPGETITVIWGEPGTVGYYSTSTLYNGRERHYEIPQEKVLAQSKQTLPIIYQVIEGTRSLDSEPLRLQVRGLSQRLPQPSLVGADSDGFRLGLAPANVPIKLGTWRLIAQGQRVSIQVVGVLPSGTEAPPHDVLIGHVLTPAQVSEGIGMRNDVTVPKSYLASLKLNERFTISVQVSFDEGSTWVTFPSLSLTLRA